MPIPKPSGEFPAQAMTVAVQYLSSPEADAEDLFRLTFNTGQLELLEQADVDEIVTILADRAAAVMPNYTIWHVASWGYGTPGSTESPIVDHDPGA